jgi:hypothetical protein
MHAVVTKVSFTDVDTATTHLRERTAPAVSQLPGFVAAYFTRLGDDDGLSMVVFDSEANAKSASETVASRIPEGVSLESVEVREVVASA